MKLEAYKFRPDFERLRNARAESRSADRLLAHFEVEARLARQLTQSSQEERLRLYSDVYLQLFESVPDHPQHRGASKLRLERIQRQSETLTKDLAPNSTYVEIGCGDAALTKVVAAHVRCAIGVDVTPILVTGDAPSSFSFVKSNGIILDIPSDSADLIYSNQLMEHLHVDDAVSQLKEIYRVLKPGGRYICCTPNRLTGPHDISLYFSYEPIGFHMREYDHRSLSKIFRSVGFRHLAAAVQVKGWSFSPPIIFVGAVERIFEYLPHQLRSLLSRIHVVVNIAGVNLVGTK